MDWLQVAALAATTIAGVALVGRILWHVFRRLDAIAKLTEHELRPNNGGSLLDKVGRTESKVDSITDEVLLLKGEVRTIHQRLVTGDGRFDGIQDQLDDHSSRLRRRGGGR